jgi:hypothetical protein
MTGVSFFVPGPKADRVLWEPQMSQPALQTWSRIASIVGGLLWGCLAPVVVYADSALDKRGTAAFALAVCSMWLVGVVSLVLLLVGLAQLWPLGRDWLGRLGQAGVVVSALALAAMAVGNGIELYTVTARGTESDIGHTIFLICILDLDRCFDPAGADPCSEAVECRRSLGRSVAVAGRTARNWVRGTRPGCCRRKLISASGPRSASHTQSPGCSSQRSPHVVLT